MSLTHMATQSMPMVSCLLAILADLSLVPTPSVPEMRTGSFVARGGQIEQAAEAADAADHARTVRARHVRLDALDDFVTGLNAYAGVLIWHLVGLSNLLLPSGSQRVLIEDEVVVYSLPSYLLLYRANSGQTDTVLRSERLQEVGFVVVKAVG